MLVVVAPASSLLVAVVAAAKATLAITAIAGLVSTGLVLSETAEAAVLAAGLASVEVVLLLQVGWVTAKALLRGLWWWQAGLAWGSIRS
jgi:hypothetical protein